MQPMQPTPYTASGEVFKVTCCQCGCAFKSTEVLCDLDGKAGDFYCQQCAVKAAQNETFN